MGGGTEEKNKSAQDSETMNQTRKEKRMEGELLLHRKK